MHNETITLTIRFDVSLVVLQRVDQLLDWLGGMSHADIAAVVARLKGQADKLESIAVPDVPG